MTVSDIAKELGMTLNNMLFPYKEVCEYFFRNEHKTIQQNFTRLCVEWLRTCATEEYGRFADGRNKSSHEVGKMFVERMGDDIYLPYV